MKAQCGLHTYWLCITLVSFAKGEIKRLIKNFPCGGSSLAVAHHTIKFITPT